MHQHVSEADLIKKRDLLDPLEDDDDISWKENPFEVDLLDKSEETPEQLLSMITFEGSEQLQTRVKTVVFEFIDVFATKVRKEPAAMEPMKIVIDKDKWQYPAIGLHLADTRKRSRRRYERKSMPY